VPLGRPGSGLMAPAVVLRHTSAEFGHEKAKILA
jgi:hypothetical protein